jgi:hypothetical protein
MNLSQLCPKLVNRKSIGGNENFLSIGKFNLKDGVTDGDRTRDTRSHNPIGAVSNSFFISDISKSYPQLKSVFSVGSRRAKTLDFKGASVPYVSPNLMKD